MPNNSLLSALSHGGDVLPMAFAVAMALNAPKQPIKLIPILWAESGISNAFMTWNSGPGAITENQERGYTQLVNSVCLRMLVRS